MLEEKNKIEKIKLQIVIASSLIFGFLVWAFIINRWVDSLFWPKLTDVFDSVLQLKGNLLINAGTSLYRTLLGYLLGCALGILTAYAMSWNKWINSIIVPYIEILRPVPALALIPFFILWFGIGNLGKILMISMGTFVVMIIQTLEGIYQLNQNYIRAATILGASKWNIYKTIIFPGSLPYIVGGLRVSTSIAFGLMIVSEFLGAQSGLGYLVIVARRTLSTDVMLLSVMVIGLLSFLFDRLVLLIGRYLTRWMPK